MQASVEAPVEVPWSGLRFAWPSPASVQVTEEGTKDGTAFVTTYLLRVEPNEGGLRVSFEDFRFVSIDGMPAETIPAEVLGQATAAAASIPDLLVDGQGAFRGVAGEEEMIEEIVPLVAEGDPAEEERLRKMFSEPAFRALLTKEAGKIWNGWVGTWLAFPIPPPGQQVALPMGNGSYLQHHRPAAADSGVHLELRIVESELPPGARERLAALLGPIPEGMEIRATTDYTVVTRADTLQPMSATRTQRMRITYGGQEQEQSETHHYTFDWQ